MQEPVMLMCTRPGLQGVANNCKQSPELRLSRTNVFVIGSGVTEALGFGKDVSAFPES